LLGVSEKSYNSNQITNAVSCFPFEVNRIDLAITDQWKKLGVTTELFILVRPDHHILYIADKLDKAEIYSRVGTHFNTTVSRP
jgi:hypothetical protein